MPQIVTWELEDVFSCSLSGWDVVCSVQCEYDEPDKSVGYIGGWAVEGPDVIEFIEYDSQGKEIRRLSREQMHDHDAMLCDYIEKLACDQCAKDADAIREAANEQAAQQWESDQEARYESRMEAHDYHRDLH